MYLILVWLEILPQLALALVYSLGVSISFVWNRRWTFESTAGHRSDLVKFLLAYGIGLLGSVCALSVLLIWFSPEVAQLFNIGATALMIYSLLRVFRFGG